MRRFPIDCPRDCPHLHSWDISIDDWTNVCDLLNKQIDDYDTGFPQSAFLPICPLEESKDETNGKYDMTFNPLSAITLNERLYTLYNQYGKGKITIEQFIALYLEDKLDDYIRKVKAERRETE